MRAMVIASLIMCSSSLAYAQTPLQRIRGTIVSVSGDALVVHGRDADVTIQLAGDTVVRTDTATTLAAIKPGSTLAIVSKGSADKQEAVGVRAMGPGMTLRLGISSWDLLPESTMTNAVVEGQEVAVNGQTMSLKTGDKTVNMSFPTTAVIAMEVVGERTALVPGAKVTVFAAAGSADAMAGKVVIVGVGGITPPV